MHPWALSVPNKNPVLLERYIMSDAWEILRRRYQAIINLIIIVVFFDIYQNVRGVCGGGGGRYETFVLCILAIFIPISSSKNTVSVGG